MALHFASFYLPLGLPPSGAVPSAATPRSCERELLDDLANHFHADVVQLTGCWLAAAGAERDEAGMPIVGWSQSRDRRLTGRTENEVLLL
jgi:hypothetical protein